MSQALAVETHGLTRQFLSGGGVREVDLAVPIGSLYGFVGPNGAGKSTTLRLLLGLLRAQAGTIRVLGQPRDAALIGGLIESPSLYGHLSGQDNLEVTRRLLDAPRAAVPAVLARVGLQSAARQRVRTYSLGMRQRLGLAQALLARPRVLILDEPANGLDPQGIADLRQTLRQLVSEEGLTVLMSSHLLSEVEQVATHIGVLDRGTLRFQGSLAALQALALPRVVVQCDALETAREVLARHGVQAVCEGERVIVESPPPAAEINRWLVQAGLAVHALGTERPTLESLFFDLTGTAGEGRPHAVRTAAIAPTGAAP